MSTTESPTITRYRRRVEAHVAERRLQPALDVLALWREQSPQALEPALLHARIALQQGRYRHAADTAIDAVMRLECPPALALDALHCLRIFCAHDVAARWAQAYPHRAMIDAADQARCAAILASIGEHALAMAWADEAVAKAPRSAVCLANRGLCAVYLGRLDVAREDFEAIAEGPEDAAIAHWQLARLQRQTPSSNHVSRLRGRIARAADPRDAAMLQFALFKELDDLGDVPAAWQALEAGSRIMQVRARHSRDAVDALFDRLPGQRLGPASDAVASHGPVPIFIVGLHRSGTTLVERVLGAHAQVHAYGESPRLTAALRYAADCAGDVLVDEALLAAAANTDPAQVRARFAALGRHRADARFVTEKTPGNFQLVGLIHDAFPQAKVVHVRRDPMDVCFANLGELFTEGLGYTYAQEDLAHFHRRYAALMEVWHARCPGFVLDVDYEAFVTDPVAQSQRLYAFCGLAWSPDVVDTGSRRDATVSTLSSVQVRQPIGTGSIGRWRRYEAWLQPLRAALQIPR